jgi:hypothetical protein
MHRPVEKKRAEPRDEGSLIGFERSSAGGREVPERSRKRCRRPATRGKQFEDSREKEPEHAPVSTRQCIGPTTVSRCHEGRAVAPAQNVLDLPLRCRA